MAAQVMLPKLQSPPP